MSLRLRSIDVGPVWLYLVSFGALFTRFGYNFGAGDQDEVVPFLSSVLDPSLFRHDWFVQTQAAEIGVRTYVVWLLAPLCRIAPIEAVFFIVYLLSWILTGSGAFRVARRLLGNDVAAAAAVFVSMGVLHKWTLGSNDLVYSMFVGEMIAWGLALHALDQWLQGNDRTAAVLLGVASWFQMLVGILVGGVLIAERIWQQLASSPTERTWKEDLFAACIFVAAALPAVVPIAIQQFRALATDPKLVFYILAPFRNPFHHMFLSFGAKSMIRFAALSVLGASAFAFLRKRGTLVASEHVARVAVLIVAGGVVTAVFTEIWPVLFIAKLQAFKLTVLLKFYLVTLMSVAIVLGIPKPLMRFAAGFTERGRKRWTTSLVAVSVVVVLAVVKPGFVEARLPHEIHEASDLGKMERWVRSNLDKDDVFAVPPSNSTFRSNARRAIVVNYAAFPFDDAYMIDWYHRLLDIAPIEPPPNGLGIQPILDAAYNRHTESGWKALATLYGIDYLLVDEPAQRHRFTFPPVHEEGRWTLYRLP